MPEMVPSSPDVSARMSRIRNRDTDAEMRVRRELHQRGFRYRVNLAVAGPGRTRPDIAFTKQKVAIFVDGCFWHRCPEHATFPRSNQDWWAAKLERNVTRDRETDETLKRAGWVVLRIWEHVDPSAAADRIADVLRAGPRNLS